MLEPPSPLPGVPASPGTPSSLRLESPEFQSLSASQTYVFISKAICNNSC